MGGLVGVLDKSDLISIILGTSVADRSIVVILVTNTTAVADFGGIF